MIHFDNSIYGRSTGDMDVEGDKPQFLPHRRVLKVKDSVKVHVEEVNNITKRLREYAPHFKPTDTIDESPQAREIYDAYVDRMVSDAERTSIRKELSQLYTLEAMAPIFGKTYDASEIMSRFYVEFIRRKRVLSLAHTEAYIKSDQAELVRLHGEVEKLVEYYNEKVFDEWLLVDLKVGEDTTIDDPTYEPGFDVLPLYKEVKSDAQKYHLKISVDGILGALHERTKSKTEKFFRDRHLGRDTTKKRVSPEDNDGVRRKPFRDLMPLDAKKGLAKKKPKADDDGEPKEPGPTILSIEQRDTNKSIDRMIMNDTANRYDDKYSDDKAGDKREDSAIRNSASLHFTRQTTHFKTQTEKVTRFYGDGTVSKENTEEVTNYLAAGVNLQINDKSIRRSIIERDWSSVKSGVTSAAVGTLIILASAFFVGAASSYFNVPPSLDQLNEGFSKVTNEFTEFVAQNDVLKDELQNSVKEQTSVWLKHNSLYQLASLDGTTADIIANGALISGGATDFLTSIRGSFSILASDLERNISEYQGQDGMSGMTSLIHQTIGKFNRYGDTGNPEFLNAAVEQFRAVQKKLFPFADKGLIETFRNINLAVDQYASKLAGLTEKALSDINDSRTNYDAQLSIVKNGIDRLQLVEAPMTRSFMEYTGVGKGYGLHPNVQNGLDELTWLNRLGKPFIARTLSQVASIEMTTRDIFKASVGGKGWTLYNMACGDGIMSLIRIGDLQSMIRIIMATATGIGLATKAILKLPGYLSACATFVMDRINPLDDAAKKDRDTIAMNQVYAEVYAILNDRRRTAIESQRDAITKLATVHKESSHSELIAYINEIKTQHQYKHIKSGLRRLIDFIDGASDKLLKVKDDRRLNYAMEMFDYAKIAANAINIFNGAAWLANWVVSIASYMYTMASIQNVTSAIGYGLNSAVDYIVSEPVVILLAASTISTVIAIYIKKETFIKNTPEIIAVPVRFYLRSLRSSPFLVLGATHTILRGLSSLFTVCTPVGIELLSSGMTKVLDNFGVTGDAIKGAAELEAYESKLLNVSNLVEKLPSLDVSRTVTTLEEALASVFNNTEAGKMKMAHSILDNGFHLTSRVLDKTLPIITQTATII